MKPAIQELREKVRWRLHSLSDSAYECCLQCKRQGAASNFWLWLSCRIDRLASWIGGPYTGNWHK